MTKPILVTGLSKEEALRLALDLARQGHEASVTKDSLRWAVHIPSREIAEGTTGDAAINREMLEALRDAAAMIELWEAENGSDSKALRRLHAVIAKAEGK